MKIKYDIWFENEKWESILRLICYVENEGVILYNNTRQDGCASQFGGYLSETVVEDKDKIVQVLDLINKGGDKL